MSFITRSVTAFTQIKLGNKAPAEKPKAAAPWVGSADDASAAKRDSSRLADRTADELEELGDEFDDDRGLEAYRWATLPSFSYQTQMHCHRALVEGAGAADCHEQTART